MKLRTKFIIAIGTVIGLSTGLQLHRVSVLQDRLVIGQAHEQARMLHKQILLTRQWVADHNGLFLVKSEDIQPNPFLDNSCVRAEDGQLYIRHNPAMVTRELAEYAAREGFCWFRVTSLKPVNEANSPDAFERASLLTLHRHQGEIFKIMNTDHGRVLRYIAPLYVEHSCLPCHGRHGYKVGDIRGALSISIPLAQADQAMAANRRSLLTGGLLSIVAVVAVLALLFNTLVGRRLERLSQAMHAYPDVRPKSMDLPGGSDEIGDLARRFQDLCQRLEQSRRRLDQAREQSFHNEKMAALGQLTAGVAHEINNPLGGLINCVKAMRDEPGDVEMHRRYLPLLDKGLARIADTMRQLLNFGRKEPLELRRVDVDAVIRECFDLLSFRREQVDVVLDLGLDRPHCLDVEALRQAVVNIGLNAIQAMERGEGRLTVASREENGSIVLRFRDTGPGIPADYLKRIFEPFFTTKPEGQGTGLGLALSHSLISRMGGSLEVESREGEGACFIITLPAAPRDDATRCPPAGPTGAEEDRPGQGLG